MMTSRETRRLVLAGAVVSIVVGSIAIGCSLDAGSHFGDHAGLSKDNLPAPPISEAGVDLTKLCNGAGPIDGGACSVSWKNDIFPMMSSSGVWKCADNKCHGAQANAPYNLSNEDNAYGSLVAWQTNNKVYLNPCTVDPDASAFSCNLSGTCGSRMPYTDNVLGSGPAQPADLAKLQTWISCGSPKN
ncbi:hypothetical protein BH09MYX1_BH09MYX1_46390 [soil metagenome]